MHTFHSENKEYSNRDLLSVREKEILLLIADYHDSREIATKLFISPNTVGNHRSNMIDRLSARVPEIQLPWCNWQKCRE